MKNEYFCKHNGNDDGCLLRNILAAQYYQSMEITFSKGISLPFYFFIWIGYVFAFVSKFTLIAANAPHPWYETVHWYVMFFYVLNIVMVTVGIGIYFRNKHLDKTSTGIKFTPVTE